MVNFWDKLKKSGKPIFALAPMAGVTDAPFRQICREFGADVLYSEMASATALKYKPEKTLELVAFNPRKERPYVVQLFGANPEHFALAARIITEQVKPDGIDINFGCPVKKVAKQGAGAMLMTDPKLSHKVIKAVLDNTHLPVSIKIRARAGEIDALEFLKTMEDLDIKAVMIHGRSMSQGHQGEVDDKIIREAKKYVKGALLANGGVTDYINGRQFLEATEADGLGVARGALGKPWIFKELKEKKKINLSKEEIFAIAIKQAKLAEKLMGAQGIIEMRKHLCWYVGGLPGAGELRQQLVQAKTVKEVKEIFSRHISHIS